MEGVILRKKSRFWAEKLGKSPDFRGQIHGKSPDFEQKNTEKVPNIWFLRINPIQLSSKPCIAPILVIVIPLNGVLSPTTRTSLNPCL